MIAFRVEMRSPGLQKLEGRIGVAIARGLNEGGNKVRTQVQRALKTQAGVTKYASITSRVRTAPAAAMMAPKSGIGPVRPGRLSYAIIAMGPGIPIREFPVHVTAHGVDAKTWGVDHLFKRSFAMKGKPIATALRARLGEKRLPIRRLYGPNLAKELGQGAALQAFTVSAAAFVPPAVMKHLLKAVP